MAVWSEVRFSALPPDIRVDAEYYRPENLSLDRALSELVTKPWGDLPGRFIVGPFGSDFLVENYVDVSPFRYIRGRDVKPFFLEDDQNCYIPSRDYEQLKKYGLEVGDLLVSVVGTLGNVSIVTSDVGQAIFSCKSTAFRSADVDPYYLCAYLNSSVGQSYLQRVARGHVQTGINLGDLKTIPIVIPEERIRQQTSELVRKSRLRLRESKAQYLEAESLLLRELCLANLDLSPQLFYERNFSEAAHRLDAEYFQPKFYRAAALLEGAGRNLGAGDIASVCGAFKYGTSAKLTYAEEGVPFLRIADLQNGRFDLDGVLRIPNDEAMREKAARVRAGDVLISRSGTLGVAVPIPPELDGAVFGSYFIRVRPDVTQVDPEFLCLFVNSLCGSLQVERLTTGGVQTNLTIPAIKSLFVVKGDLGWQRQFVTAVRQSVVARKDSERLLREAKRMVEEMILLGAR